MWAAAKTPTLPQALEAWACVHHGRSQGPGPHVQPSTRRAEPAGCDPDPGRQQPPQTRSRCGGPQPRARAATGVSPAATASDPHGKFLTGHIRSDPDEERSPGSPRDETVARTAPQEGSSRESTGHTNAAAEAGTEGTWGGWGRAGSRVGALRSWALRGTPSLAAPDGGRPTRELGDRDPAPWPRCEWRYPPPHTCPRSRGHEDKP